MKSIRNLICVALLGFAALLPSSVKASGSCLFDAHMTIASSYTVEWTGTPPGPFSPPINGANGDFDGVGLISSGTACNSLNGLSFTVLIPVNWIGNNPSPLTAGTITISCWKYNSDGTQTVVTSQPYNIVIDPFCSQCTFQFYVAACDGAGACQLGVCKTCMGSSGQQ
jgi:hypothetical protein